MAKTHQLIWDKLEKFPPDVQVLAIRALELAETMPESSVTEQLKGIIRQLTKDDREDS
jgi:hypothetical protein